MKKVCLALLVTGFFSAPLLLQIECADPASAMSDGSGSPIPPSFFGMHLIRLSWRSNWFKIPVGSLGKTSGVNWPYIEPASDSFNWSGLDGSITAAASHGMTLFYSNDSVPAWATSNPSSCHGNICTAYPVQEQNWINFITALVSRYRTTGVQAGCSASEPQCHGVIPLYELWNEPSGENGTASSMVTMTRDEYNAIRSLDPGAAICSPAFTAAAITGSYMANYFAAGGPTGVDCVDFHINGPTPEAQIPTIRAFNSVRARFGLQDKTVYATEAGRWSGCSPPNPSPSDELQEAYIARIEPIYWSMNVQRHYWYAWDTCAPLWDASAGAVNPAGRAYQAIEMWMSGAAMNVPCSANGTVWTCGFIRRGGYQGLEVWNTSGTSNFAAPSWATQYRSLNDTKTAITTGQSLTIGILPILIESSDPLD